MLFPGSKWDSASKEPVAVVAFTASWCQPCSKLKPQFARAASIDADRNYYILDVDEIDQSVLELFSIRTVPQIWIVSSGSPVREISARTAASINQEITGV
jgi:thioredoxin-like negative regulator of GroEL